MSAYRDMEIVDDSAKWRRLDHFERVWRRLPHIFMGGLCAGVLLWGVIEGSRPSAPPPCMESAKVIILHDKDAFTCQGNGTVHHEKMDDYKVYVECKCK